MLNLQLAAGEYVTINDNIIVQVFPDGQRTQMLVKAPREIPVMRGALLEREGRARPEGLPEKHKRRQLPPRLQEVRRGLAEVRELLRDLGPEAERAALEERIERLERLLDGGKG